MKAVAWFLIVVGAIGILGSLFTASEWTTFDMIALAYFIGGIVLSVERLKK